MNPFIVGLTILLLAALVGELLLGFLILQRAGGVLPARFLAGSLILHALAFSAAPLAWLLGELDGPPLPNSVVYTVLWVIAFVPALDLAFALSYPTVHPRLENRRSLLLLPFVPSLAALMVQLVILVKHYQRPVRFEDGMETFGVVGVIVFVTYVTAASLSAAIIFYRRANRANTSLERQRLRFVYRVVSVPMLATVVGFFTILIVATFAGASWNFLQGVALAIFSIFVLIPSVGTAYGLLRYQILDLKGGLRLTLSRSLVGTTFVVTFFVVSESSQIVLADRFQSALIGVLGSALVLIAIHPIQRAADRLASRTIPEPGDREKYLEFRKWEIYRATYEDVVADARITQRERRTLASLAKNLGLPTKVVKTIEAAVESERTAAARSRA